MITSPEHAASSWLAAGAMSPRAASCIPVPVQSTAPRQPLYCVDARSAIHAMSSGPRRAKDTHLLYGPAKWIVLAWTLCAVNTVCRAGNILVFPTPLARSHHMGMQAMASELAQRGGHQVMVSPVVMYGNLSAELERMERPTFGS